MRIKKALPLFLVLFLIFVIFTDNIYADISKDTITAISDQFKEKAAMYGSIFEKYAKKIFYWCLMLDVALIGVKSASRRADISETIASFVTILLFSGFCFAVITHYKNWTESIINGLGLYAKEASGVDLTLSPFKTGFDAASAILDKVSFWSPADSLGYIIAGGIIIVIFSLMSARILLIKCESYIAMNAAILLLGFGGTGLLKDHAINTMKYAFSVAFKLLTMQLVMGVGMSFIKDFRIISTEWPDLFILIACALILLVIMQTVPETVASIINGSHVGGGVGLGAATGAVMAVAGGAVGAAIGAHRTAGTVADAVKIASLEGHSGADKYKAAGNNLMESYKSAHHGKNSLGSIGQRASANMKDRLLAAQQPNPPKPVSTAESDRKS